MLIPMGPLTKSGTSPAPQPSGSAGQTTLNGANAPGEAAIATRAETAERVDPPAAPARALSLPGGERPAAPDLLPPNPAALAGPTPAFERSVLEARLQSVREPAPLILPTDPAAARSQQAEVGIEGKAAGDQSVASSERSQMKDKAEASVGELRQLGTTELREEVDVIV